MKIRWKLFVALVLVVAGGTVGTLVVAERGFRDWVRKQVGENFEHQVKQVRESRMKRQAEVSELAARLSDHEVVMRALSSQEEEVSIEDRKAMLTAVGEARNEERRDGRTSRGSGDRGRGEKSGAIAGPMPLMGVLTNDHRTILISDHRILLRERRKQVSGSWKNPQAYLPSLTEEATQLFAYGLLDKRGRGEQAKEVKEVVVTPVMKDGERMGWFFFGIDAQSREERVLAKFGARDSWTGLWVDGKWFLEGPEEPADGSTAKLKSLEGLTEKVESLVTEEGLRTREPMLFKWQDERHLLITRELNPESPLGQGAQVAVFNLSRLDDAVEELRWSVGLLGAVSLLVSIVVAWAMSRRFSEPILRLVEATKKVREGDLDWQVPVRGKDEFAVLAGDFNRMTKDLHLKEKYRDLLGKTSDPSVANRLMEGSIQLGGEVRQAAVVFCDIRGFTAMTDGMAPAQVIELLNDHMTAMTQVIHEHGGVVDKFVGDLVMAVFGAPISRDDDTLRAAACATAMIRTRRQMNATMDAPVEIGIGLAAGEIVSGLMGSVERLNYTVLGDRVNLAARLCSRAASGEVLVDGETAALLPENFRAEPHGSVEVKGFRSTVEIWALRIDQP